MAAAPNIIPRPPVVTVMGHIDHGKSTLLDYIRKSKVTETEAGGITQHLSAYEVEHEHEGSVRRITFLDTPGHEAFQHLRSRGSSAADLAILVVAADDGVKPQTLEALKAIREADIPFLVALSKIDKPNANVERAKASLLEHGVYLEGMGGDIPYAAIDSKSGRGVSELLDLLLLAADLRELTGDTNVPAEGIVIESQCHPKKGMFATLIIKNGSLKQGQYVVAGATYAPLRMIEDFKGKRITSATFSSPVTVTGFSDLPPVGERFITVDDKLAARTRAEAAAQAASFRPAPSAEQLEEQADGSYILPIILKCDVTGSVEALEHELKKLETDRVRLQCIHKGVGSIVESDIKHAAGSPQTLVLGFNVGVDARASELAERMGVAIGLFRIIYEVNEWVEARLTERIPVTEQEEERSRAQVLKSFSATKKSQTVGARVLSGTLEEGERVRVLRKGEELVQGRVESLQAGKSAVSRVESGNDCGAVLALALEQPLTYGDELVTFRITKR